MAQTVTSTTISKLDLNPCDYHQKKNTGRMLLPVGQKEKEGGKRSLGRILISPPPSMYGQLDTAHALLLSCFPNRFVY